MKFTIRNGMYVSSEKTIQRITGTLKSISYSEGCISIDILTTRGDLYTIVELSVSSITAFTLLYAVKKMMMGRIDIPICTYKTSWYADQTVIDVFVEGEGTCETSGLVSRKDAFKEHHLSLRKSDPDMVKFVNMRILKHLYSNDIIPNNQENSHQ